MKPRSRGPQRRFKGTTGRSREVPKGLRGISETALKYNKIPNGVSGRTGRSRCSKRFLWVLGAYQGFPGDSRCNHWDLLYHYLVRLGFIGELKLKHKKHLYFICVTRLGLLRSSHHQTQYAYPDRTVWLVITKLVWIRMLRVTTAET